MSTRARGRAAPKSEGTGRGAARSRAPDVPSRPPHESTMRDLIKDQPAKEGQFDDADDHNKRAGAASLTPAEPSLIEGNPSNIEQAPAPPTTTPRDYESSNSSINPTTPEISPPSSTLNPSAPVFSPTHPLSPPSSASSKLNPRTPEFSPSPTPMNGTAGSSSANQTQAHPSPSNTGLRSALDPRSSEFIPKIVNPLFVSTNSSTSRSLNVSARPFVPTEPLPSQMQNGQLDDEEDEDPLRSTAPPREDDESNEGEPLLFTPKDILSGVTLPVEQGEEDVSSAPVLKAAAEVLIKTTLYPGSFDRGTTKLENTVNAWLPTEGTLANLAEILIHWGVTEPSLRLSVSRICQVLSEMEQIRDVFRKQIVVRMKVWYDGRDSLDKDQLINLSLFFAEIFSRIRTIRKETKEEVPVVVLGQAVLNLLTLLLNKTDERSVISACHILKLTGPLLATLPEAAKLGEVTAILEKLSTDESLPLSKKCVEIMVRVLELQARGWGQPVRPLTSTPITQSVLVGGAGQVVGGASHIPPDDSFSTGVPLMSEADVFQAPVSNPDEWSEFLDDDNQLIEDNDQHTTESFVIEKREDEGDGEDELDAEMEKEYEFFVQDLEEHLLNMGEMDPEQLQEQDQQ